MSSITNTPDEVDKLLAEDNQYKHFWVELSDGQNISVMINGEVGWLWYNSEPGDAGSSTRNPAQAGATGFIEYQLDNGQVDEYPTSWSYPVAELRNALHEFLSTRQLPSCLIWHDDSENN